MNFLDDEGRDRVRAAYGLIKYQRPPSRRSGTPTTSSAGT
jgi:hypothetical protein